MRAFIRILLFPMARFCVRHGILLPQMVDALKASLLSAAEEHLAQTSEPVTASRLSIMTGVHRKDTSLFLKGSAPQRDILSPAMKVLGCWHTKKRYLSAENKPKRLSIGSEDSEFARLVREVSADIHPYTVLRELERLELVQVSETSVVALKPSLISSRADDKTANILARDIDELLLTAEENIEAKGARPNHHTTTLFDNIPGEYADEIRTWINQEASLLHKKIRERISQYDRDLTNQNLQDIKGETIQFVFSSFGRVSIRDTGVQDET